MNSQTTKLNKLEETNEDANNESAPSEATQNLYKTAAAVQTNETPRVVSEKNEEDIKEPAIKETQRSQALSGRKCPEGTIFNPVTGECE